MWTFALFMLPGMHREVHAARAASNESALDDLDHCSPTAGFSEHLHQHDDIVTPRLESIRAGVLAGERSENWLEEQFLLLLDAMFAAEEADARRVRSVPR